jgi:hypothetical protein
MDPVTFLLVAPMIAGWLFVGIVYLAIRRERSRDPRNVRS